MRAKVGEQVICSDGETRSALAEIVAFALTEQAVELRVTEWLSQEREPQLEVWIAQALPKGDKLETVWQKCTELGAQRLIPFVSERTIVQYDTKKEAKRVERWQKIVKEAAEQAHRERIPKVEAPMTWKAVLALAGDVDLAVLCYEKAERLSLRQVLADVQVEAQAEATTNGFVQGMQTLQRVLVVIGPEGGFSEQEVAQAEQVGMRAITLGKRILRTETAALVALSCLYYASGDLE
jgi:16S rRNA (uracil1498-N3)-methyltransferase